MRESSYVTMDVGCCVGVSQGERVGFYVHNWDGAVRESVIWVTRDGNCEWK